MLPPLSGASRSIFFAIKIPAQYVLISENGLTAGWLDGAPHPDDEAIAAVGASYQNP